MQIEFEQLGSLSESWLPVLLAYSGKLALALLTLALGWWLINRLSLRLQRLIVGKGEHLRLRAGHADHRASCEAIGVISADDNVIEELHADALQRGTDGLGRLRVRLGRRGVAGGVVMDQQHAVRAAQERHLRNVAWIDLRLAE